MGRRRRQPARGQGRRTRPDAAEVEDAGEEPDEVMEIDELGNATVRQRVDAEPPNEPPEEPKLSAPEMLAQYGPSYVLDERFGLHDFSAEPGSRRLLGSKPVNVLLRETVWWCLCCCGKCCHRFVNYRRNMNKQWDRIFFRVLNLRYKEVNRFFRMFQRLDTDQTFDASVFEMLMFLDLDRTALNCRLFQFMDADNSGALGFHEFVLSYWHIASLTKIGLWRFIFSLFKSNKPVRSIKGMLPGTLGGQFGLDEIEALVRSTFGANWEENKAATAAYNRLCRRLTELTGHRKPFNEKSFLEIQTQEGTLNHLLSPVVDLQTTLQRRLMSQGWWERQAQRRFRRDQAKGLDSVRGVHQIMEQMAEAKRQQLRELHGTTEVVETVCEVLPEPETLREWRVFRSRAGTYWYDGQESVWKEPPEQRERCEKLLAEWGNQTCRFHEVQDGDGGFFYSDGKVSLWEKPIELIVFELAQERGLPAKSTATDSVADSIIVEDLDGQSLGTAQTKAVSAHRPPPKRPPLSVQRGPETLLSVAPSAMDEHSESVTVSSIDPEPGPESDGPRPDGPPTAFFVGAPRGKNFKKRQKARNPAAVAPEPDAAASRPPGVPPPPEGPPPKPVEVDPQPKRTAPPRPFRAPPGPPPGPPPSRRCR